MLLCCTCSQKPETAEGVAKRAAEEKKGAPAAAGKAAAAAPAAAAAKKGTAAAPATATGTCFIFPQIVSKERVIVETSLVLSCSCNCD